MEQQSARLRNTGFLTFFFSGICAITAAVVGVILNLALFFGYHVLWPQGFGGSFDAVSALIALGAAFALFLFKLNVMHVITASAVVGLVTKLL